MTLTRRIFTLGALGLPGCTAIDALNQAALPLDTYALQPIGNSTQGDRSSRTLLVLEPTASAAIATDRVLIRRDPLSVTYLPDARWADSLPQMLQSIFIQSLASAGRIGFVGAQGAGPVPDTVLLTRIDAFGVDQLDNGGFQTGITYELTVLRDRDQRVLGTRRFAQTGMIANDQATTIVRGFQTLLDGMLPEAMGWVLARAV